MSLQQLQECGVCRFHLNFQLVYIHNLHYFSLHYFRLCRSLFVQQFKLGLLDPLCDNPPSAVDPWPSRSTQQRPLQNPAWPRSEVVSTVEVATKIRECCHDVWKRPVLV